MLREAGVEVETFFRNSDDIAEFGPLQKAALAISPTYNVEAVRAFRQVLRDRRPDVVHLHNPFPLISPWVIREAKRVGVPIVQTVHNYRISCPAGTFFRDGQPCEECAGKSFPWPALRHGCYQGSRVQSAPMAVAHHFHRSTWLLVDRFLPVSDFVAEKLLQAGIPPYRVSVKPNAIDGFEPSAEHGTHILFAGRLSAEKGVELLLKAWNASGVGRVSTLVIAGDGPLRSRVEAEATREPSIRYIGRVGRDEVSRLTARALAVIVPSECYEALPTSALEAFAAGRPVITTAAGAAGRLVTADIGWVVRPTVDGLAAGIAAAAHATDLLQRGRAARHRYETGFTREVVLRRQLAMYESCLRGRPAAMSPEACR